MEVSDGRMVRSMLAVYVSPIRVLPLQSFSKKGIERLVLWSANVQSTQCKSYHQL